MPRARLRAPRMVDRTVRGDGQHHSLNSRWETPGGLRVRVSIRLDASYPVQSRARAEVWRGDKLDWSNVAVVPVGDLPRARAMPGAKADENALLVAESKALASALWALGEK